MAATTGAKTQVLGGSKRESERGSSSHGTGESAAKCTTRQRGRCGDADRRGHLIPENAHGSWDIGREGAVMLEKSSQPAAADASGSSRIHSTGLTYG